MNYFDPAHRERASVASAAHRGRIPALFVAHWRVLEPAGGGVQLCNREYMTSLDTAGFQLNVISYEFKNSLGTRLKNRLAPKLLPAEAPGDLAGRIEAGLAADGAKFVFHAMNAFPSVLCNIGQRFPGVRQVMLSHGTESIDFCIEQGIRRDAREENRSRATAERMLGRALLEQREQRRHIDAVLTLSSLDAEVEKWLGARRVLRVPRTIPCDRLNSEPIDGRVGCVATLDHPPNASGLDQLLCELAGRAPADFRLRLVGGPTSCGATLAARHAFVDYLGPLSDEELRAEAASWCCFVNPIFVYSKGCSTKLAVALGWGLPVATTRFGARGYEWDERMIPLAEDPPALAEMSIERARAERFDAHCRATRGIAAISPDMASVGRRIRDFLLQQ
jgi:hypothetical protein